MAFKQSLKDVDPNQYNPNPYNVSNPHPNFGIDPNIKNEFGHTEYPKWVDHPTEKDVTPVTQYLTKDNVVHHKVQNDHPKRVLVQNAEEEKALLSGNTKPVKAPKGWDK